MMRLVLPNSFSEQAKKVYYELQPKLEKQYPADDVVLINIKTGEYFVGETTGDTYRKAKKRYKDKYPGRDLVIAHVGQLVSMLK